MCGARPVREGTIDQAGVAGNIRGPTGYHGWMRACGVAGDHDPSLDALVHHAADYEVGALAAALPDHRHQRRALEGRASESLHLGELAAEERGVELVDQERMACANRDTKVW